MSGGRLTSRVVPAASLGVELKDALFALYDRHYQRASRLQFEADLADKDHVILLLGSDDGQPRGFSTQKVLRASVGGAPVRAIFSGDTVIDKAYWGEQVLVRSWCGFAGRVRQEEPDLPLFWFLIVKGFRTYLYLPLFFRDYHPRHDAPTPSETQSVMDALATRKFGRLYDPGTGLVTFQGAREALTPGLALIPPGRRDDPRVRCFLERNPGYARGDELVCLTRISAENMKGIALKSFLEGSARGPLPRELVARV